MGSGPLSFSLDPSREILETVPAGRAGYRAPLLYSLLIHSVLLALLLALFYRPDQRPVKEVGHWGVNLVSPIMEEPKSPQTVLPEEPQAMAGSIQPVAEARVSASAGLNSALEEGLLPFQESPLNSEASPDSPLAEFPPAVSPPPEKRAEETVFPMQQSADQHLRAGQYFFRMRFGDRMIVTKMKYFQQTTSAHLNGCIQIAIPEDLRKTLQGKSTLVRVLYQEDGTLREILFDDRSDEPFIQILKDAIPWDTLNAPRKFGLPFREMKVRIAIDAEGKPSSRITLL
ncbi:MAG: hypothetical protein ACM3N7_02955 [Planctomycetaceae bacterium]